MGEATFLALAWKRGADPYRLYNSLDDQYRPLSERVPCPSCPTVRKPLPGNAPPPPCSLCGGVGRIELPLAAPGEPRLPLHPERVKWFIYGCAKALTEAESGKPGSD